MKPLILALLSLPTVLVAQIDTIYSLNNKLIEKYTKEGANQYLVFIQPKKSPQKTVTYVWSREVSFNNKGTEPLIEIRQKWYASDTARNRYVYSTVKEKDFTSVYHLSKMSRGVEAYDFYSDRVKGSDSVANNTKKDFILSHNKPFLNWELDLEIFPLLDLKPNKKFAINFYHPGGRTEPKLYLYSVVGEETITTIDGAKISCWKLKIDYTETSWAMFYISKKGHEVLKMEEDFGSGIRYKVKLSTPVPIK